MLLLNSIKLTNPVDQEKITKDVIFELSQFRKSHNISGMHLIHKWNQFIHVHL